MIRALFAAILIASLPAICKASAETRCAVPDDLVFSEETLPRVARQVAGKRDLRIVIFGTSSSREDVKKGLPQTYAAMLPAQLQQRWPGIALRIENLSARTLTAEQMAARIKAEIAPSKPDLVIWQTGNVDAAQQIDVNTFEDALTAGLEALKQQEVDVVLVAPQYRARLSTMVDVAPYDRFISQIAQAEGVLVFPRFDIMRHWMEEDIFDLRNKDQAKQLAEAEAENRCLSGLLADMIARAAKPAQ